ncbi:hypothetical protein [Polluticaenibacter yanchengensis]|uniref:Outer membrane beta-barrel protein n=1 Tax=Polluticaenibacter yanchengensis TaxID=3014562 RepID=A0ABT4UFG7_9BACT|nr:hypothetical protein [Chitinophagaceae bacterium LY-5]
MSNQFEKDIQDIIGNHKMHASPDLWQQIEPQLPEEKKRRKAIIWWAFAASLLTGSCLIYHYQNNHKAERSEDLVAHTTKAINENENITGETNLLPRKEDLTKNNNRSNQPFTEVEQKNKGNTAPFKTRQNKTASTGNITIPTSPNNQIQLTAPTHQTELFTHAKTNSLVNDQTDKLLYASNTGTDGNISNNIKANNTETILNRHPDSTTNTTGILLEDMQPENLGSTLTGIIQHDTLLALHTDSGSSKKEDIQKISKKGKWQVYASAGASNTNKLLSLITHSASPQYLDNSSTIPNNSGSYNGTYSYGRVNKPITSLSLQLAVQRKFIIGRHFEWYVGTQMSYLSNLQERGTTKDTSFTSGEKSVNTIYRGGNIVKEKNHNINIGLLLGINYLINPKGKHPFYLNGGLMPVYSISQKQIHVSNTASFLFYNNNLNNRFNLAADAGINWQFSKKSALGIQGQLFMLSNTKKSDNTVMSNKWKSLQIKYTYTL